MTPDIDPQRLLGRIDALGKIGATKSGGVTRLALSEEDKKARRQLVAWMQDLGLNITVDRIGNIYGTLEGKTEGAPVMTGSHLDTVIEGGRFDGAYGVLAGLEVLTALKEGGIQPRRPLCVAAFTNEEGVRFHPDMMGSLVVAGGLSLEEAYRAADQDGITLKQALLKTGQAGETDPRKMVPSAFVEIHIEQGPFLEAKKTDIGVVENLTGISWNEVTIEGVANHAGTTPMDLRKDACFAAARLVTFLNRLAHEFGPGQRATVGRLDLRPNAINVVPGRAVLTVDLRNPDNQDLTKVEKEFHGFLEDLEKEGFGVSRKQLARFDPVTFDPGIAAAIEKSAQKLKLSNTRMTSGAGHDAQMMARVCPAGMIFVPSIGGISHNPAEDTRQRNLLAGCRTLLHTLLELVKK